MTDAKIYVVRTILLILIILLINIETVNDCT